MELKKKLLETKNITLKQALEKARAWETANIQAKDMASGESKPPTVNYVKHLAIEENSSTITVDERATSRGIECAQQGAGNVPNAMFLDTLLPAVPRGKEKNKDDTSNNKSFRGQQKRYIRRKQGSTNQVDENGYSSESS